MKPLGATPLPGTARDTSAKAHTVDPATFEITPPASAARATAPGPAVAAPERNKSTARKVIVVIGAENAPGLGLVRAIVEDLKGEFAARAIVGKLDSPESRFLGTLGADLVAADARDAAGLKKALAGAYGAFYIQLSSEHPSLETKLATANAVARAAQETGLKHVVWATLEDPGQTLLEHNDVTPTFQNGRWISDREAGASPEQVFADLAIPTTFLHTTWEPSVAAGKWTEDIGRHAYGILRNGESVGQTVSISAARLIRRQTPPPIPPPGIATPVTAAPIAGADAPAAPELTSSRPASSSGSRSRTIAIVGMVAAVALVALVVTRQIQRQQGEPKGDPVESSHPAAPAPVAPPVAVASPETHQPAPPPPVAPTPETTPAPPVAAAPETPPPVPEMATTPGAPQEPAENPSNRAGARHASAPAKLARRDPPKPAVAKPSPVAAPHDTLVPHAPAPVAKAEPPPKIEPAPEREAPAKPASPPVAAVRAPAPPSLAPAPPPAPAPRRSDSPQPGYVDPKAVAAAVRSHAVEANTCYDRAVMEHPDLHGRLTLQAVIDPTGRVISVSPTSAINGGARLQSCLTAAFKIWAFPRPAGGVNGNVTYSFSFESANAE